MFTRYKTVRPFDANDYRYRAKVKVTEAPLRFTIQTAVFMLAANISSLEKTVARSQSVLSIQLLLGVIMRSLTDWLNTMYCDALTLQLTTSDV